MLAILKVEPTLINSTKNLYTNIAFLFRYLLFILHKPFSLDDPLGQTHIHANCDHYSHLSFVLFCEILNRTYVQTTRAKIVIITTGRDCGSDLWINKPFFLKMNRKPQMMANLRMTFHFLQNKKKRFNCIVINSCNCCIFYICKENWLEKK